MQFADSITKSFLSYGNPSAIEPNLGPMSNYQDPTYMGFQIRLVNSQNNEVDLDDLPHGLFAGGYKESQDGKFTQDNKYSTYNYFINRGEYKRAEYIRLFETGFSTLLNDCPWYFVKVSGLADAWKIDPKVNWRAKDKKITVETLESIDMKMTYLIDCYRKAVFDAAWMRWAVPDHMRWFKMDIIISEVRPMKIGETALASATSVGAETVEPSTKLGRLAKKIGTSIQQKATSVIAETAQNAGINLNPTPREYGLVEKNTPNPWSAATFIKFSFEQCELDLTEAPPFLETVGIIGDNMATNKFVIKPGVIRESNTYGLLGAMLDDTLSWFDYNKDAAAKITQFDLDNAAATASRPETLEVNPLRKTVQKAFNDANGKPTVSVLGQIGNKALVGATAYATNAAMTAVNGFLLGNVYGVSPLGLFSSAQGILNNPAGAIEGLLTRFSSPGIAARMAKSVELTGAEIHLVKSIIGKTPLESEGVQLNRPGNVGLVSPGVEQNTLGKENLVGADTQTTPPGKTILSAVPSNTPILGSTTLESPSINTVSATKVDLLGPEIPPASKQKTNLTAFATAGQTASKVNLRAPVKKRATNQNVSLEGAPAIIGNLGDADVSGAPVITGDLGDADISGAPVEAGKLGKADLTPPSIPPTTLGKANL